MKQIMVDTNKCEEGAVLAEDVVNENGMVMLRAGSVLTGDKINALLRNGINTVPVVHEEKLSAEQIAEKRKKIDKKVSKLFRKSRKDECMSQFESILVDYYVERC